MIGSAWTNLRDRVTGQAKARAISELQNRFKSVTLQTAYGPDLVITDPLQPGPPNPYLQALKPKITINFEGAKPIVMAPYGEPGASRWGEIKTTGKGIGIGLGVLTVALLVWRYKKKRR